MTTERRDAPEHFAAIGWQLIEDLKPERHAMPDIELIQPLLGLKPYVLIEFFDGGEDEDDLRATVRAGAGITSVSEIRSALEMALDSLPTDEPA